MTARRCRRPRSTGCRCIASPRRADSARPRCRRPTPAGRRRCATTGFDVHPVHTAVTTDRGRYWTADGRDPIATHFRPIQPRTDLDVTPTDGAVVHGALITALASTDVTDVNPVLSRPTIDLAAHEPEAGPDDVAFPATLQRVQDYAAADGRHVRLNLAAGQFLSDPFDPAERGVQRLFTRIAGNVLRSRSTDFAPPRIDHVETVKGGGTVTFDVTTPDGDVTSGLALYQDGAGVWRSAGLAVAGGHARGTGPLPGDAQAAGVAFVQLVDAGGNVGLATDKGVGFALTPTSDPGANAPPLLADPLPGPDGTTPGPVTVRIAGDARATATVSVDGAGFVAYDAPIVLQSSGVHVVTARAPDGSTSRLTIIIPDAAVVAKPTLASTTPVSPSTDDHPRVKGTAPGAANVVLYAGSNCSGAPIGEGSAADFERAGIAVSVTQNAATTLRAVAVGPLGQRSECSTSTLTYVHVPPLRDVVLADAPVGYWRFGEPSGTTALDWSTNANNGTYINGPLLGVPGALAGDTDTAVSMDGVNDSVRVPDHNTLDVGDSFTAEGWIKRSSTAQTHTMMVKGFQIVVMNAANGNQVFLRKPNVSTIARTNAGVGAGAYHHIVVTKNATGPGSVKIYIDGAPVTVVDVSAVQAIQNTTTPLQFGDGAASQADFDEFALYDNVLTPAQVAEHYAAGTGD